MPPRILASVHSRRERAFSGPGRFGGVRLTRAIIVSIVVNKPLMEPGGEGMAHLNELMENGGEFVSVADAARYLGVGRRVVYQLIEFNRVRAVRRRQYLLVDRESLEAFRRTGQLT